MPERSPSRGWMAGPKNSSASRPKHLWMPLGLNMWNIQLQFSLILASFLLSLYLAERRINQVFWLSLLSVLAISEALSYAFFKWMVQSQIRETARFHDDISVPLDLAKEQVIKKLKTLASATPASGIPAMDGSFDLPQSVREFFAAYESVAIGGIEISVKSVAKSKTKIGFIKIGSGEDSTEIIVRPNDERVWESETGDSEEAFQRGGYPSIWHFLLLALE
jgi:hypothetical protein